MVPAKTLGCKVNDLLTGRLIKVQTTGRNARRAQIGSTQIFGKVNDIGNDSDEVYVGSDEEDIVDQDIMSKLTADKRSMITVRTRLDAAVR